jgi:hypothetical protein
MLAMCQKPEGPFKAPTYLLGGSNFSRTRQGGSIFTKITMLTAMVLALLVTNNNKYHRENNGFKSFITDFFIDFLQTFFPQDAVFSLPKGRLRL